jgi:protocatechuate 3,4-dioxygenase alpha subunit
MLKQQVTRLYFSDEIEANTEDPVLNSIEDAEVRDTLVASKVNDENDMPCYKFNIHLQGEKETAFFDV